MKTINTALLSFGMSGRVFHAPLISAHPGFRFTGCWERSSKIIENHYANVTSYQTLDDLLADPAIDLVVVNTPTYTHYPYTKMALEHGKHVVVEKAFAGSAAEAIELRDLAVTNNLKLAIFQNRRWDSDFLCVKSVVDRQILGDIVEANLGYLRYDAALSPKFHKENPSSGSGILKDLGPHIIDQALVLFGMPEALFADISVTREASKVDDYFDILLKYNTRSVHLKAGYFFKQPLPEYSLFGKLGCFTKERADVQEAQLDSRIAPTDSVYGREPDTKTGKLFMHNANNLENQTTISEITAPRGSYIDFYHALFDAIANDKTVPVTADDGVRVMQIIDAALLSHRAGKVVQIETENDTHEGLNA